MIFSSVTRISSPDRKRETEHVPSQMKTNYLSCICHLRPSPSCLCCWHHLPCMGTHGPGGSTGNLWSQRTAQGTRRCRVSFSGCWQELSWDGRSQLATTYTTEGKADEKSDSAVPMLPEAQCCIEMGKLWRLPVRLEEEEGGMRFSCYMHAKISEAASLYPAERSSFSSQSPRSSLEEGTGTTLFYFHLPVAPNFHPDNFLVVWLFACLAIITIPASLWHLNVQTLTVKCSRARLAA